MPDLSMKKMTGIGTGLFLAVEGAAVLAAGLGGAGAALMKVLLPLMALMLSLLVITSLIMLKKDGLKSAIVTTLLIGIALGAAYFLGLGMSCSEGRSGILSYAPARLSDLYNALFIYVICMLLAAWICILAAKHISPEYSGEYVIILGCGLKKDGTVGTNLTARIRAALAYRDQRKKLGLDTVLVASGGQGEDEALSEAESIRRYLEMQGEDVSALLLETRSVNTRENLLFSKELIERETGGKKVKTAYATSSFHLFRTGILADRIGLDTEGIGCPCPWYDSISLYFRECVALVWQGRKFHLCAAAAMVLFALLK